MRLSPLLFILSLLGAFVFSAGCDDDDGNNTANNVNNTVATNNANNTSATNNANNTTNNTNNVQGCTAPPRNFWNYDLSVMPPRNVEIPATCYGMGPNVYVYVADEAWGDGTVTQEMVDDIVAAWEEGTTPQGVGIYEGVTTVFGTPPDVDEDPRIIVFVTPLGSYNGTAFDGYFKAENQTSGPTSNMTEMVYIDCGNHEPNSTYLLGVLAHEFQHLISYGVDMSEEGWLDETFSQAAMFITGYWSDLPVANSYLASQTSSAPLVVADSRYYSYGAGFLFASYTLDRYGEDFFADISQDPSHGEASIDNALMTHESVAGFDFYDLLLDWATASLVRDCSIDAGQYCYLTLGQSELTASPSGTVASLGEHTTTLPYSGYTYLTYNVSSGDELTVSADGDAVRIKAVLQTSSGYQVSDVDLSAPAALPVPSEDGAIILVVVNASTTESVSVTVQ